MLFMIYVAFSSCRVFGIDFGRYSIKISQLKDNNIQMISDSHSDTGYLSNFFFSPSNNHLNIERHSVIETKLSSWAYSINAKKMFSKNNSHGIFYNKINNLLDYSIKSNSLSNKEVYGLLLRHIIYESSESTKFPEAIIVVPPNSSSQYKYSVYESLRIGNISLKGIIESPTSIATVYAMEHYKNQSQVIAFIDFGYSQTTLSTFSFTFSTFNSPNQKVLIKQHNQYIDFQLSEQNIDLLILKYLQGFFHDDNHSTFLPENKLQKIAEKIKEKGSSRFLNITRDEVYKAIKIKKYFKDHLSVLYEKNAHSGIKIDKIELLGGGSKFPFIEKILAKIANSSVVDHTMNPFNTCAMGAIYTSAVYDSTSLKQLSFKVFSNTNVSLFIHNTNSTVALFNSSSYLSDTISYSYPVSLNSNISILSGIDNTILTTFYVNTSQHKFNNNSIIKLNFGFDNFGLPGIYEISIDNKTYDNINFQQPSWAMTKKDLSKSHKIIKEMERMEQQRKKIQKEKNNLEALIFEKKRKVNKEIQNVTTENERKHLIKLLNNSKKLIEDNYTTIAELKKKQEEIKDAFKDPEYRLSEIQPRQKSWIELNSSISLVQKALKTDLKEEWVNKTKLEMLKEGLKFAKNWRKTILKDQNEKKMWENPVCSAHDIHMQSHYLMLTYNFTLKDKYPSNKKETTKTYPHIRQATDEDILISSLHQNDL